MAVIKTIFKGESISLLFTFPVSYDMARIEKHEVYIGETAFTGTVSGKTVALKLKSDDTGIMSGQYKVSLWIDDTTLGVRKPYIGDIVFSNTNATPHNTSTSEVTDIIIPIVISETAVTVGDILYNYVKGDKGDPFLYDDFTPEQLEALKVKGDKGDSFEYADFTPEQIATLQQPATDAAASVQGVEQAVEQAEGLRATAESGRVTAEGLRVTAESNRSGAELLRSGAESDRAGAELLRAGAEDTREMNEYNREDAEALRVQAEIDRQTNTGTAIQNAETATKNASDAAILANTKAGLANDAATNANTKAGLADTAATNANTKAGLANTAATNADNARLAIQADLASKENTANKQNSLVTDGTGTKFPTVDAVNAGLAGVSNLIASYTHSGNKEVAVTSVDLATGVFTAVRHGLINGDMVVPLINLNIGNVYPIALYPKGLTYNTYYITNATVDTFNVSLTSGGASQTFTTNSTMDLTKWHFEKFTITALTITGLDTYKCRIEFRGRNLQAGLSLNILPVNIAADYLGGNTTTYGLPMYEAGDMLQYIDVEIDATSALFLKYRGIFVSSNTETANIVKQVNTNYVSPKYYNQKITQIFFNRMKPNGTTVKIYKME